MSYWSGTILKLSSRQGKLRNGSFSSFTIWHIIYLMASVKKNARDSFFPASLLYGFRRRRKISEQDASFHANANLFGLFSNIHGRLGRTLYELNKRLAHFLRWWCKTSTGRRMMVLHHFAGLISRESRQRHQIILELALRSHDKWVGGCDTSTWKR